MRVYRLFALRRGMHVKKIVAALGRLASPRRGSAPCRTEARTNVDDAARVDHFRCRRHDAQSASRVERAGREPFGDDDGVAAAQDEHNKPIRNSRPKCRRKRTAASAKTALPSPTTCERRALVGRCALQRRRRGVQHGGGQYPETTRAGVSIKCEGGQARQVHRRVPSEEIMRELHKWRFLGCCANRAQPKHL